MTNTFSATSFNERAGTDAVELHEDKVQAVYQLRFSIIGRTYVVDFQTPPASDMNGYTIEDYALVSAMRAMDSSVAQEPSNAE